MYTWNVPSTKQDDRILLIFGLTLCLGWCWRSTGTQVISVALSYIKVILAIMFAKQAIRTGWDSSPVPCELEQLSFHANMGQAQGAQPWPSVTLFHSVCIPTSGKSEGRLLLHQCLHCTLLPFQSRATTRHCWHTHPSLDCGGLRAGDGTVLSQSPAVQSTASRQGSYLHTPPG